MTEQPKLLSSPEKCQHADTYVRSTWGAVGYTQHFPEPVKVYHSSLSSKENLFLNLLCSIYVRTCY